MDAVLKGEPGALFLFLYLLPGFLGSVVFDYLVERPKPSNFERIVEALVLTLSGSVFSYFVMGSSIIPGAVVKKEAPLTEVIQDFIGFNLVYSSIGAVAVAAFFAILNNHNILYRILNKIRVTYKRSDADVWYDIMYSHRGFWLNVKFEDGRNLIGWPKYYSQTGKARELFIADATWIDKTSRGIKIRTDVDGPGVYIYDFSKVVTIEILNGVSVNLNNSYERRDMRWLEKLKDLLLRVSG